MLDFPYPLFVLPLLDTLHLPKQRLGGLGPVASHVAVEYPSIKNALLPWVQNPCT